MPAEAHRLYAPAPMAPAPAPVPVPAREAYDDEDDAGLGNLLQIAWQRKWTLLLCLLLSLVAGVIYVARATPIYQSTAMVYLDQNQPQLIAGQFGGFTQQSLESQTQVLTSTTILARAMELPAMKQAQWLWEQDNPLGFLRLNLDVQVGESGDIMLLSLESPDPQDNAIAVNTVVQAFSEYHSDRRRNTAAEVLKVLQREKFGLNEELSRLTNEMLAFQRRHGAAALRTAEGGNVFGSRVSRLANTLTEAELRTLNAKLAYETAVEAGDDLEALRIIAATDPSFAGFDLEESLEGNSGIDAQIASLMSERKQLTEVRGLMPSHKSVALVDSMIEDLERSAGLEPGSTMGADAAEAPEQMAAFYRGLLRQRWDNAQEAERELRVMYESQQSEAVALNSLYAEYGLLESAQMRADRQLEMVDQRIRELNLNEDYDVIDVTVLEPAEASEDPIRPKRAQTLMMALTLGLMLGVGVAFLQELLDDRLRSGEEIASLLRLPILGVVPEMDEKSAAKCGQLVDLQPQSVIAEAFRTIRTAIHFSPGGSRAQVIMVTSPSPGDGKTTVASNLAIAIAQAGKRTLLIDGDCRKPRQHRIFEVEPDRGLISLLTEVSGGAEKRPSPIMKTQVEHLHLLPCGSPPDNPAELLNGRRFGKLIEQLRGHYDQIVIDTPPTVPVSDSRIISSHVDGYVLVLRAGKSGRKMAKHAVDLLASTGANPLGMAINGVTSAWGSYSYYSRYGYYQYGYGEYRDSQPEPRPLTDEDRVDVPVLLGQDGDNGAGRTG
jgi:capsular exopolysaccharide synthesis family protein